MGARRYLPFAFLAGLESMRINSGHLSRTPLGIEASCQAQVQAFERGEIAPDVVYVIAHELYRRAAPSAAAATCGRLDGEVVCVAAARRTALSESLAHSAGPATGSGE